MRDPSDEQMDWLRLREARDDGIRRSRDHAENEFPTWGNMALLALRRYITLLKRIPNGTGHFTALEMRTWVVRNGLVPVPPTNWAWGSVMVRAQRAGLVKKVGTKVVGNETSHLKESILWRAV